jgi:hypothetical protein
MSPSVLSPEQLQHLRESQRIKQTSVQQSTTNGSSTLAPNGEVDFESLVSRQGAQQSGSLAAPPPSTGDPWEDDLWGAVRVLSILDPSRYDGILRTPTDHLSLLSASDHLAIGTFDPLLCPTALLPLPSSTTQDQRTNSIIFRSQLQAEPISPGSSAHLRFKLQLLCFHRTASRSHYLSLVQLAVDTLV